MDVLIGLGGSELSYLALEKTIERGREAGDSLTVVVFDSEEVPASTDAVVAEVHERLVGTDFQAEVRRLEGDAGAALVDVADREGFDRIVLGSGRRSTLGKVQLGTVAEFVLLNAQTPVTLVR
jgi:nucleotide-binding universal stress UspA family protein